MATSDVNPNFITAEPVSKTGMKQQLQIIKNELDQLFADTEAVGTSFTQTGVSAVARTFSDKLRETALTAGDFAGADPTGATDTAACIQALFTAAGTQGRFAFIPAGTWRINTAVVLPSEARGLIMEGELLWAGTTGPALTIGNDSDGVVSGYVRPQGKSYTGIRLRNNATPTWAADSAAGVGLLLRNCDDCFIDVQWVEGFTIGIRAGGYDVNGFEDNIVTLGRILNNKIGLDMYADDAGSWCNANALYGGHFTNASTLLTSASRVGVRFSNGAGGYDRHNHNTFYAPRFEIQDRTFSGGGGGAARAIHFVSGDTRGNRFLSVRTEGSGRYIAKVDSGVNDTLIDVAFVGTFAYNLAIEWVGDASDTQVRKGLTLRCDHQTGQHHYNLHQIAAFDNIRATAFSIETVSTGGTGFDRLAVLSSASTNPDTGTGPPDSLNGFMWPGLSQIGLNADHVQLPTSRAIVAVLDLRQMQADAVNNADAGNHGITVSVDGDNLRLVVQQFDATETLIEDDRPPSLSNANLTWSGGDPGDADRGPYWHEMSTNLDQTTANATWGAFKLAECQTVYPHPDCAYIAIGFRGGDSVTPTNNRLRSMAFYCENRFQVPLVWGPPIANVGRDWGYKDWYQDLGVTNFATVSPSSKAYYNFTNVEELREGDMLLVNIKKTSGFQDGSTIFRWVIGVNSTKAFRLELDNTSASIAKTIGDANVICTGIRPRK